MALAQDPADASALARQINAKTQKTGKYESSPDDSRRAVRSLVDEPLSRSSLRIIGFNASAAKNASKAEEAMRLSNKISRRDSWAQIWLVEQAARKNDFDGILAHLHAALTVTPDLAPALNPILIKASSDPDVQRAIQPYMRSQASWTPGFLDEAAKSADLADLQAMVAPVASRLGDKKYLSGLSHIIFRLAADGKNRDAMTIAKAAWTDFDPVAFGEFAPTTATADERLGRLAWVFGDSDGVSANFTAGEAIEGSLAPLSRGLVASRAIPVEAGTRYIFSHRVDIDRDGSAARLTWSAQCLSGAIDDQAPVFWRELLPEENGPHRIRSTMAVPRNCKLIALSLVGSGADGQTDVGIRLSQLSLKKAV